MNIKWKKPWVKPELRPLKPTRELLSLFERDAPTMTAMPIAQKK